MHVSNSKLEIELESVHQDSRKVTKNSVFVAIRGTEVDGHLFLDDAIRGGASVIICEESFYTDIADVCIIEVENTRKILGLIAQTFATNPAEQLQIIGITGTNGKTTTVSLLTEMLSKEMNVLMSGNIGIPFSKIVLENKLYNQNDIDYCILELSSFQLEHCSKLKKEISVILNISLDHMDRYNSFEDYFETKIKIFENAKYCLFNYDDNFLNERIKSNDKNIIPFSIRKEQGYYYYDRNKILSNGNSISIDVDDISLKGIHNISNIIIAAEIARIVGIDQENIRKAVSSGSISNISKPSSLTEPPTTS